MNVHARTLRQDAGRWSFRRSLADLFVSESLWLFVASSLRITATSRTPKGRGRRHRELHFAVSPSIVPLIFKPELFYINGDTDQQDHSSIDTVYIQLV